MRRSLKRREFLALTTALGAGAFMMADRRTAVAKTFEFPPKAGNMSYEIMKSDAEWRQVLTDIQYAVLREEATERPFTHPLNDEKRVGTFHCAGCDLPLYHSSTKFDSGTGWPSFYDNIDDAVRIKEDRKLWSVRTEVHCRRCAGHLGHIFKDGPPPTGLRHCINGVSLKFVAA